MKIRGLLGETEMVIGGRDVGGEALMTWMKNVQKASLE